MFQHASLRHNFLAAHPDAVPVAEGGETDLFRVSGVAGNLYVEIAKGEGEFFQNGEHGFNTVVILYSLTAEVDGNIIWGSDALGACPA